jgi:hypothetical protein
MIKSCLLYRLFGLLVGISLLISSLGLPPTMSVHAAPARSDGLSAADWSQIQSLLPTPAPPEQRDYLKASNTDAGDYFGYSVAVSGNTAVIGAPKEASNAVGVNGAQDDDSAPWAGAAYVMVRDADGNWSQQAYLKASNAEFNDYFGGSVAISGDTIVVGANNECGSSKGVNGNQADNSFGYAGAAYVFVRSGTSWSQQAYLKASNSMVYGNFGYSVAITGDTIVVGSPMESNDASGVNSSQVGTTASSGAAYVFTRSNNNWTQQVYIKASNTGAEDRFGQSVAISGGTIVVGAPEEDSAASGINGNQANESSYNAGAAYVFAYTAGNWAQQAYLKASNNGLEDYFGSAVAISADTIVVGAPREDSNASGVGGTQANESSVNSGAAYVFTRANTLWTQQAYMKASNTGDSDLFGTAVVVSGDKIVVGAPQESSNATGINGNQADDSAFQSGAAYQFLRSGTAWTQHAYLKASNTGGGNPYDVLPIQGDYFGSSLSIDAGTLLVGALYEDSSLTGVNGSPDDDLATNTGSVYLFSVDPILLSFSLHDPLSIHTSADALIWRAIFDSSVQNVDAADFMVAGGSTALITDVISVNSTTYEIMVAGGDLAAYEGSVGLDLDPGQDITNSAGDLLPGIEPAFDDVYVMDNTTPLVISIKRADPHPTDADQVAFAVKFTEPVSGVAMDDFSLSSQGLSAAAITGLTGSGALYTVTVSTGTGSGYLRLNLPNTASITDLSGKAISGLPYNVGQTYIIDKTGPSVSSVTRSAATPSSADSLAFTVLFSEAVMDVDVDDFSLAVSGLTGSSLQSVSGSGRIYSVTVTSGYGSGTLQLVLPDTASFTDLNGNPQISLPFTSGESYTVKRLPVSFNKSLPATGATTGPRPTLTWQTSSLASSGYEYCLVASTSICSSWTPVAGTSQPVGPLAAGSYKWQVRALNPGGTTYANGADAATWAFTVDATKPVVSSIALADPNPSTAASLRYTVTFSKNVTGVNAADFGLTAAGLTGAAITGVSAVSAKVYTVTVSTGTGTGTLRLDVKADGTILDAVGNALSAAYNTGPKYTLDRLNTFTSAAANDGWVLELNESSGTGSTLNSTLNLMVGDSATKQQYRSILSFDTSALPDNATIVRVTLKLHKLSGTGANPFTSFQGLLVDVKQGFFGTLATLQATDFSFAPSLAAAGTVSLVPGTTLEYKSALLNTAFPFVSKNASTQLRLAFKLDDNNNAVADTVSFASGNHLTAAFRPVLVVEYTLP